MLFSSKDMKNAVLRSLMILNIVFWIVSVIPLRHILCTIFAQAVGLFLISQERQECFSSHGRTFISKRQARELHGYRLTLMFINSTGFVRRVNSDHTLHRGLGGGISVQEQVGIVRLQHTCPKQITNPEAETYCF